MQGLGKPVPCHFRNPSSTSSGESRADSPAHPKTCRRLWSGTAALYWLALYTQTRLLSKAPPTFSLRKEVIQPQVLLRLPCYDFTPIMSCTLEGCLLAVSTPASSTAHFRDVTGGVYKARERIHRIILIHDY